MSLEPPKEEKFFFNRHFFDADVIDEEETLEAEEEHIEDIAPPPPTFSEEELKAARDKAYEAGKTAGYKEAENSIAQSMLNLIQSMQQNFGQLLTREQEREDIFEQEVIKLNAALFKKIAPQLIERYGYETIEQTIRTALKDCKKEEKITIHVHKTHKESFETLLKEQGFENFIINDGTMETPSSCRLEWQEGGMILDIPALSEKIEGILNQFLEEKGANSHDSIKSDENTPDEVRPNAIQPGEDQ